MTCRLTADTDGLLPDRLMSVSESRVVVPAAVRMLTDWSVTWLQ